MCKKRSFCMDVSRCKFENFIRDISDRNFYSLMSSTQNAQHSRGDRHVLFGLNDNSVHLLQHS